MGRGLKFCTLGHREWVRICALPSGPQAATGPEAGKWPAQVLFWRVSPATEWRRGWRKRAWMQGGWSSTVGVVLGSDKVSPWAGRTELRDI